MFAKPRLDRSCVRGQRSSRQWLALPGLLALWLLLSTTPLFAANPPPVQIYYVPAPEDDVFVALQGIFPGNSPAPITEPIINYISLSVIAEKTILYYDHWEDGFEIDISNPTQPTTEIWGDGNLDNGMLREFPADEFGPNAIIVLKSSVNLATRQSEIDFDGGDKFGATRSIAVTRATWDSGAGTLLAGAMEVYPVDEWGTTFRAPAGVDTPSVSLFEYTSLVIMATDDNTTVQVDVNADGTFDQVVTLNEGESHLTVGTIQEGARVQASAPVQVGMITGDIADTYEGRWYVLFPEEQWSSTYYSPVSASAVNGTTAFLFNRDTTPMTVTRTSFGGATLNTVIQAMSSISVPIVAGSGARFASIDGRPFAAIAAVDSTDQFNSKGDWGFAMIPEEQLTMQTLIGWGAGHDPAFVSSENSSPIWVIPVDGGGTFQICVDHNGDNQGSLVDANGFRYDQLFPLSELEVARVVDTNDGNQTGSLLYVCPTQPNQMVNAKLAAAWGQDPDIASPAEPALDLGTTAPPAATFEAGKAAEVIVDHDGDGKADAGDTLRYTVIIRNAARVPIPGVTISDTVPLNTSYVLSSTTVDLGSGSTAQPDNGTGTPFPLDEGGIALGELPVRGLFTVTFAVLLDNPLPLDIDRVRNVAVVRAGDEERRPEVETPVDFDPTLEILKLTNGEDANSAPGPQVRPGEPITWTYVVTNTGVFSIPSLSVLDSDPGVTPTLTSGDGGVAGVFEAGEVRVYNAYGIAVAGQYSNTGTAIGVAANGDVVTDTDVSHYFGVVAPAIDLEKSVSRPYVPRDTTVVYTFTAQNSGTEVLTNVVLIDNQCAVGPVNGDVGGDGLLDLTEVWTYTCTRTITRTTTNVAVVTGVDAYGTTVTDTDSVQVIVPILYLPLILKAQPPVPCPPPDGCAIANEIKAMAVSQSQERLYVVARNPDELLLLNPVTTEVLTRTATGAQPWGIAVNEQSNRVYVSNFASGDVRIYDGTTLALLRTIPVGTNPSLIERLPGTDTVFVLVRGGSRVAVINGLDLVQDISSGGSGPFGIAADAVNQRIFISHRDSASMTMLRQVNGAWQSFLGPQFDDGRQLFELAYAPNSNRLFVVYADGQSNWFLDVWEPHDNNIWGRLSTQAIPSGGNVSSPDVGGTALALNAATGNLFNVNTGARSLSVVDSGTLGIVGTVALGEDPFALAIDSSRNRVYVGLRAQGRLVKLVDSY
jgi:uncharacterized repeat protein (TIGR01451 family)